MRALLAALSPLGQVRWGPDTCCLKLLAHVGPSLTALHPYRASVRSCLASGEIHKFQGTRQSGITRIV